MTAETLAPNRRISVCRLEDLQRDPFKVVSVDGRSILVLFDEGKVFALDNRCPHMGFPLHRGTVRDGILTCHWHHAKFDLAGGCTLDPFADDAPAFAVDIREGLVYVKPTSNAGCTLRGPRMVRDACAQLR